MKYFLDSEFLEDGSTIDLISIAFVAEDGREYYAVNKDADWSRIRTDKWLMEHVVNQLPVVMDDPLFKPKAQIAEEVLAFLLAGEGRPELWAWYSAYDHVVFAQLWGKMIDLPEGMPMYTNDTKSLLHWALPRVQDRDGFPSQTEKEHDALADARHVKVQYDWIMERKGLRDTDKVVERLLAIKRDSLKELAYQLIEAKRRNEDPFIAATIEVEKFRAAVEISLLEWLHG